MKGKEKPKYGIWENVCFMMRTAWKTHKEVPVMCAAIAALGVAWNVAQLYVTPQILAKVEQGASIGDLLLTIGIFFTALFLLSGLKGYLIQNRLPAEVDVRCEIIRAVTRKTCETSYPNIRDPNVLKRKEQADRATSSNHDAAEHIWTTISNILTNGCSFFIYLLLLADLNPFLIALVIVTSVVVFFATRYINEWEHRHREEKETYEREIRYFQSCSESLKLAKEVRIFGLGGWLRDLQTKSLKLYAAYLSRREKAYIWANVVDVVMTFVRNVIAYIYLIGLTLKYNLPASEFLLYFTAVGGFTTWITGVLSEVTQLHKESIALSGIQEYLNIPEPFRFEDGVRPPASDEYELKLEDVTFCYPGTEKNVLAHINLTIRPGEKLAIVGVNGAGKTTLVKLLCGFYDPSEGRVLLNGQDIRSFNRRQYYELFSAVFQEFSVLDTTIEQTVAQSVSDIDRDKVRECLDRAGLTDAVAKFPNGVDTHIGREVYLDGVMLSGGQMQRLMLARALYKDGPILVLDEPTAALDPIAENDIYMKYNEMTAHKTSVFISHRLASTRFCDRIIFVSDGTIAEEGTHEALLAANGAYAKLFEVQSRYYREGGKGHEGEN